MMKRPASAPIARERNKELKLLEKRLEYRFRNRGFLNQALTHASYGNELGVPDNERLEFLGDSILGLVISAFLYHRYPNLKEGPLSKLRSQVVCGQMLYKKASTLSLDRFLLLGKGEQRSGGQRQPSNLACALEAIFGAIYLDRGPRHAGRAIQAIFERDIEIIEESGGEEDYKSIVQEIALKKFKVIPKYVLLSEGELKGRKRFEVGIKIGGQLYGRGIGFNKKQAEQESAREAFQRFKKGWTDEREIAG